MSFDLRIAVTAAVVACVLGILVFPILIGVCHRHKVYDTPGGRKVHHNNIPRLGGLVFLPAALIGLFISYLLLGNSSSLSWLYYALPMTGMLGLYVLGGLDDLYDINARIKFLVQILCAVFVPLAGFVVDLAYMMGLTGVVAMLVNCVATVFVIVFVTNAINLIDGIDGLAASISIVSLVGFAWMFNFDNITMSFIGGMTGVLIAFLRHNLLACSVKNRLFMGDSGSLTLGYALAFLQVCVLSKTIGYEVALWKSVLLASALVAMPVLDECRVILIRLYLRKPLFQADKRHFHHFLMSKGMNQHQALMTIVVLQLAVILLAYVFVQINTSHGLLSELSMLKS